jgi:hypothetical protein
MLSFLREQHNVDLQGQKPHAPAGKPRADGPEPPQEQEYLTVAAHGRRTRTSTILLTVLFIIGLLCLWFMIKKSTPHAASATTIDAEETKVEAALARLTGAKSEMFSRMDEIVKKFYEFSGVLQVQVNELARNPFTLELFLADPKNEPVVQATSETDLDLARRQQIRQKTKDMKLLSIMRSDQATCCMIGSKILREGDSIQGFTVREIGDNSVKLEWTGEDDGGRPDAQADGVEIVLKLSE